MGKDDEANDPTGEFRKLDAMLPKKKGQSPMQRVREIEGKLDWMRSHGLSPETEDAIPSFDTLGAVPIARRAPEERAKDLEDALNWMKNKGKDDDANDPTGEFRSLDAMLPKKKGQSPMQRVREIEGKLDWMRSHRPSPEPEADTYTQPTLPTI